MTMTTPNRSGRLLLGLLMASNNNPGHPFAPPRRNAIRSAPSTLGEGPTSNSNWRVNDEGFSEYIGPKPPRRDRSPSSSNWTDEFNSSRNNPSVNGARPPRRDHEAASGNGQYGNSGNNDNSNSNVSKESFQQISTDDFKRPHGMPPGGGEQQRPPPRQNVYRHPFQSVSTDDFKRPHGMPPGMDTQFRRPPPGRGDNNYKSPFQTSSTDDFKRSSDAASGVGAPQQAAYRRPSAAPSSRSDAPPWSNRVGQDAFDSTQMPPPRASGRNGPSDFFDAEIIADDDFQHTDSQQTQQPSQAENGQALPPSKDGAVAGRGEGWVPDWFGSNARIGDDEYGSNPSFSKGPRNVSPVASEMGATSEHHAVVSQQPPAAAPPLVDPITNREQHSFEAWDDKFQVAQSKSRKTLLRNVKWPLTRDPLGVGPDYPSLTARVAATVLATVATRYLHLFNNCSPVLASAAVTLLVSTCLDRRLGQAALCGSFAGMSGGHLVPNISMAVMLGGLTSVIYELLIHVNNLFLGIGGRLGATAFLATSAMARYRGVGGVGRRLRRGMWRNGRGPSDIVVTMVLFHALGSVATIFLRVSSDDSAAADPVRASSVVGLLGSLFVKDPMAALALYGGSFVGMSLPSRLMYGTAPGNAKVGKPQTALALFTSFAGAGAIAGLIHAVTMHYGYWNGGWGGKAALCAFAGCWVYRGFGNIYQFLQQKA